MKELFKIFLSMLVVSIMLIGTVGAESTDSTQDELLEDEYYLPTYGANTFATLNEESDTISTFGSVPDINDDKEKIEWISTLRVSGNNSMDKIEPYFESSGGALLGYGVDYGGYMFIEYDNELADDIDDSMINELYDIINEDAKEMGISNVPVAFIKAESVQLDSRTTEWTSLIGGIKIVTSNGAGSTLSFAAEDSSGNEGFVISGHAAYKGGGVGTNIYQPDTSRYVGEVDYYTAHYADAAWVEASNVADDIYYANTDVLKDVTTYGDPSNGSKVYMSGYKSGTVNGYIKKDYFIKASSTFGYLYDQFAADYESDRGDSGAPIFQKTIGGVKIVGVHWSHDDTYSYFSPISGVILDLDVTPLY